MKTIKKIVSLVILLLAVTTELFSNPVDVETAKIVAQNFTSRSRGVSKTVSDVVTEQFEGQNSFHVVNFREGGWVTQADVSPTHRDLRIAYEWGKGCSAHVTPEETGLHSMIRACDSDNFATAISENVYDQQNYCRAETVLISSMYTIDVASRRYRAPIRSKEQMTCNHRFLTDSFYIFINVIY